MSVIEHHANSFIVTAIFADEQNGYWRNNSSTQIQMTVRFSMLLDQSLVERMWVEFDILDSGNIVVEGVGTVSKQSPIISAPISSSGSVGSWQLRFGTRIDAGIRVKRMWFDVKQDEQLLGQPIIVSPPNILVGNGYKNHHYSRPGMPAPYISGRVKHRGQPAQGTITMSTADNPEHIIPTDNTGRYFYQTSDNRMQLVANSNWFQHNDIVRREVYPNTDIGLPDFVNKFDYNLNRNALLLSDILVGLVANSTYYQFTSIPDNGRASATVTYILPTELLCVDWTMESDQDYDRFTSNDWNVSGYVSGTVALQASQKIEYTKDGSGSRGFDNVHFLSFKIVNKEDSMAVVDGYVNSNGGISSPNYQDMTTDFIDIGGKDKLTYEVYPTNPNNRWVGWCFYDKNKHMVGSQFVDTTNFKGTINAFPAGAKFIRIGARYLKGGYLKIA